MKQTYDLTPETLRIIRNATATTQQELADLINVERSTIAKIEAGTRSITQEMRHRLELALNWEDPTLHDVISSVQHWNESAAHD